MKRKIFLLSQIAVIGLATSGCVAATAPAPTATAAAKTAPAPRPVPPPTPAAVAAPVQKLTGDWRDWPISRGNWVYRQDQRGSIALFGSPDKRADFLVRCNQNNRQIYVSRAGRAGSSGSNMTLRATSGLKSYVARNSGGSSQYMAAQIAPSDNMLDKIAFSRGRFMVQVAGTPNLLIPIWPEFTRVVEDCRR